MTEDKDTKKYEALLIINELSEIIKYHSNAVERLERFTETHPYIIAPNIFDLLKDHLRDNINILLREFNSLQKSGKAKKKYEKKNICEICHSVFLMPLPDGICDECRSKGTLKSNNS